MWMRVQATESGCGLGARGTHKNLYSLKQPAPIHELITSYSELITFLLMFQLVTNMKSCYFISLISATPKIY